MRVGEVRDSGSPPSGETKHRSEKVRAKNSKAQKKYRDRKQEEKKQLVDGTLRLAEEVSSTEAQRDALRCQVAHLQLRLQEESYKASNIHQGNEAIYIPAIDGFNNLRTGEKPGLMLRAVYNPLKHWTYSECMALTVQDFAEIRKDTVLKAGQLLLANPQCNLNSPEGQQMKELQKEAHGTAAYLAVHKPHCLQQLVESRLDDPEATPTTPPPKSFWTNILMQLKLTEEQQIALVENYTQQRDKIRELFAEREQLRRSLISHIDACDQVPGFATEGQGHSSDRNVWGSLVRKMRENVDGLHMAKSKFNVKCSCLWTMVEEFGPNKKGINVFQDARLLTLAWPYWPKINQCVEELARQRGELQRADTADEASILQLVDYEEGLEVPYKPSVTKLLEEYMEHRFKLSI